MSAPQEQHDDEDLRPTFAPGYKPGEQKTLDTYRELDKNDESLNRWKASLGIDGNVPGELSGPKVTVISLTLTSPTLSTPIVMTLADKTDYKKNPITIKEGAEYAVTMTFMVNHSIVSGLRYLQVVKRTGIKLDKMDSMIGSYGPSPTPYTKVFASEEAPSGMLARSGTYTARSRVTDDDMSVYADFEWTFKIGKEWA
ncbi:E set domain-containing protein [Calocera cornea HHB12733]|uniref:Rho GDP-dissociation inhibitor n=1 Tax=Calocera cornea HHB12733 TaxID=1353952 RepID=A0A165CTJ9_9BASI|nr:E set domain-containing protein [Calocera cornea HHB12733]